MVYSLEIIKYKYVLNEKSNFQNIFSDKEKDIIVNLCERIAHKKFTNDVSVRLEKYEIDNNIITLKLAKICFYDFLVSTYLKLNFDKLIKEANIKERETLLKFNNEMCKYNFNNFESIISNNYLSNILAVSLVIIDMNDNVLLVKRNLNVGISNGFISTSVTGSVDEEDYNSIDPILSCAKRETLEELNYMIDSKNLKIIKLVCGCIKTQPIALVNAYIDDVSDIINRINANFKTENQDILCVKRDNLCELLNNDNMTEACKHHLQEVAYNG